MSTPTTVAELTPRDFGAWVEIPAREVGGYLYGINDEFNDGYPSRTLCLVSEEGHGRYEEFTDSDPASYPKTMRTPVVVDEDQ